MTKPLTEYKKLNESSRRLVNKLITSLSDESLDDKVKKSINRTINRARRGPDDKVKKYANGYTVSTARDSPSLVKKTGVNQLLRLPSRSVLNGGRWTSKAEAHTCYKLLSFKSSLMYFFFFCML